MIARGVEGGSRWMLLVLSLHAETIVKPCTCGDRTSGEQPAVHLWQILESVYIALC
jgi:hypothetical protein